MSEFINRVEYIFNPHTKGDTFKALQFRVYKNAKRYNTLTDFPLTGEELFIYMDLTTSINYKWNGTAYAMTTDSPYVDLTGSDIVIQLRSSVQSPTVALEISNILPATGITITDGINGLFQINKQIINIPAGTYYYDIEFTLANNDVFTYIYGTWKILQDITQ